MMISSIDSYLAFKKTRKAKLVIYTAIASRYDDLVQHRFISRQFDYVCFSDEKIEEPGIWEVRQLDTIESDPNRSAKYYKIFPNIVFPEYDYSIWIDANIDIWGPKLENRVLEMMDSGSLISANVHFARDCAYEEGEVCIQANLDDPMIIKAEMHFLREQGFPEHFGLFEMNIIFRKHNDRRIDGLMSNWWSMICKYSKRDQISFPYVLKDSSISCEKMFHKNSRFLNDFKYLEHRIMRNGLTRDEQIASLYKRLAERIGKWIIRIAKIFFPINTLRGKAIQRLLQRSRKAHRMVGAHFFH
ncbi:MAG: glycosyltransferase domain-containing protein [Rectinemataceae bacterium]|jgi:hypothetical protein